MNCTFYIKYLAVASYLRENITLSLIELLSCCFVVGIQFLVIPVT